MEDLASPSGHLGVDPTHFRGQLTFQAAFGNYTYATPLITDASNTKYEQEVFRFCGGIRHGRVKINIASIDESRERYGSSAKAEKVTQNQAIVFVSRKVCARNFTAMVAKAGKDYPHATFEKMLDPSDVVPYLAMREALCLGRAPLWWRPEPFSTLENLCRTVLDEMQYDERARAPERTIARAEDAPTKPPEKVGLQQMTAGSFDEWFHLFVGFYMDLAASGYYSACTGNTMFYTREFIDAFADYLAQRHRDVGGGSAPIALFSPLGRLAHLLNATKRIPVPVKTAWKDVVPNPYYLVIPPSQQAKFRPHHVEKCTVPTFLDKHKPALVVAEPATGVDITAEIRRYSSVREYCLVGVPDSGLSGSAPSTWGIGDAPAFLADGFTRTDLPHVSRYLLSRYDNPFATGFASVTSFSRAAMAPTRSAKLRFFAQRLRTRF